MSENMKLAMARPVPLSTAVATSTATSTAASASAVAPGAAPTLRRGWRLDAQYLPLATTIVLFLIMATVGSIAYTGFFSAQVFLNLLIDNAFLIIVALGMTFVILAGGIDLSVGSMVALSTMVCAALVEHHHWNAGLAIAAVLLMGSVFGAFMGWLIHRFRLQPFIVTLAGMFLARGLCYLISIDSISITEESYTALAQMRIPLWGDDAALSLGAILALVVLVVAVFVAHYTEFGRTVYAIGGNVHSAVLMGLPVARTTVLTYTLSGFCSALGGVAFTFYTLSGYGLHAVGLELDAIAAVVIGGTLLSGGAGFMVGSLFGVLTLGIIQSLISFDGSLSSWWTRIVIGALLFVFCLLQRLFEAKRH